MHRFFVVYTYSKVYYDTKCLPKNGLHELLNNLVFIFVSTHLMYTNFKSLLFI
jgi:hypothetical protein